MNDFWAGFFSGIIILVVLYCTAMGGYVISRGQMVEYGFGHYDTVTGDFVLDKVKKEIDTK